MKTTTLFFSKSKKNNKKSLKKSLKKRGSLCSKNKWLKPQHLLSNRLKRTCLLGKRIWWRPQCSNPKGGKRKEEGQRAGDSPYNVHKSRG